MPDIYMFDFDGVIVDSLDYFFDSFIEACQAHGYVSIDGREPFLRLFDTNMYEGMAQAGIPQDQIAPVLTTMAANLRTRNGQMHFFEGMPETLARLCALGRVWVITSNMSHIVGDFLRTHGITCLQGVLGADVNPSKVRKIADVMAQTEGHRHFYIGDTMGDMIEGRTAGAQTVAVTWGWHSAEHLAGAAPDHMVHSPGDLLALFEQG